MKNALAVSLCSLLLLACGPSTPEANEPDDVVEDDSAETTDTADETTTDATADEDTSLVGQPCGDDPAAAGFRVRRDDQCFTATPAAYCEANCGGPSECTWQDEEGGPSVLVECGTP